HMDLLGDTLPAIAAEKAGIIKEGVPVVVSERQEEVASVFEERANKQTATLYFANDLFDVQMSQLNGEEQINISQNGSTVYENMQLPLKGAYQQKNLLGVIQTVHVLRDRGWEISDE